MQRRRTRQQEEKGYEWEELEQAPFNLMWQATPLVGDQVVSPITNRWITIGGEAWNNLTEEQQEQAVSSADIRILQEQDMDVILYPHPRSGNLIPLGGRIWNSLTPEEREDIIDNIMEEE